MAIEKVRHASIYYNGRRVGKATGGTFEIMSNSEDQIADEGRIGTSVGPKTCKLTLNAIVPVAGIGISITQDLLDDKLCTLGVAILDGSTFQVTDANSTNVRYEWDATKGSQTMSADFTGGKPTRV